MVRSALLLPVLLTDPFLSLCRLDTVLFFPRRHLVGDTALWLRSLRTKRVFDQHFTILLAELLRKLSVLSLFSKIDRPRTPPSSVGATVLCFGARQKERLEERTGKVGKRANRSSAFSKATRTDGAWRKVGGGDGRGEEEHFIRVEGNRR